MVYGLILYIILNWLWNISTFSFEMLFDFRSTLPIYHYPLNLFQPLMRVRNRASSCLSSLSLQNISGSHTGQYHRVWIYIEAKNVIALDARNLTKHHLQTNDTRAVLRTFWSTLLLTNCPYKNKSKSEANSEDHWGGLQYTWMKWQPKACNVLTI